MKITSSAIPLNINEIDTDQIIPARFLKATNREGFGDNLMRDWRYDSNNNIIKEFPLNNQKYKGTILVAGYNFGCGSSREHAAWAIADYGFKIIIAKSFADIFKNNALNNGIVPICLPSDTIDSLIQLVNHTPESIVEVNLETLILTIPSMNYQQKIELSEYKRTCIVNNYDDIDYLLNIQNEIEVFEKTLII